MGGEFKPGRWGSWGAQLFPLGVAAVAVSALVGWKFGVMALTRISPEYVPIAPSSAFGLLALSASMFVAARWPGRRAATGAALAGTVTVTLVAVLVLLDDATGIDLGLENALQVGPQLFHALPLARMSPLAAALFLLVAVSLVNVFPPAARVHLLVETSATCAALVLAGGAVVTMGYLLGAPLLYGGPIKPVAMPTGIAFVLAGAGLLARLQVLAGGSDNKGAALVAVGLGVAVSFGLYAIVETAELAASMPHVPWRGRALLAGCLGLTWLLAVFLRAQGRHRTETERANRELHAAEARMHAVIESANDAIVTTDIRGAIVSWNAAAERIFGYTGEEAARMTLSELIPERLREADRGGLERAADSGKFYLAGLAGELVGFRKSGVEFPVELSVARWSVADDVFFTAIMRDITERRQAEELEAVVLEISQSANQAADLGQLLRSIHEAVKRLMNARNFYVALHDPETGLLSFPYFVDESDPPPAPRPSRRGLTEYVLRTCKPQFVNPEMIEDLVQRGEIELVGTPAVDWLGVPLLAGGRAIGALVVQSYTEGTRYGARELEILTFMSRQLASAVERRRAQDELARSEARYRAIVEDQTELICRFRPDGEVTFLNGAFLRYFGRARKSEIGSSIFDALPGENGTQLREGIAALGPANPVGWWRLDYESPDHGKRVLAWTYRAISDEGGRPVEIQAVGRDVTQQIQLEEQLREAQKLEAVAVLAGGVAHEFNNDLQSMLATANALRANRANEDTFAAALGQLEDAIKRSARHTRQLLLFSHQNVSKAELVDLNQMIAGAGSLVESLVPATVRLTVEPGDGVAPVRGDRGQLEQVLTNLVVNGVDAMPQGGDLKVRSGRDGEEFAWLEVEDAGMGIPADVRARLFEPFFTTKKGGTGLGLSVTQGIVTGLGGRIEVTSEIGKGSTFRVVLPMLATAEPNESLADPRIDAGSSPAVRGERILVVEDEEDARAGLIEALGMLGYRIVGVGSGEEALRAAGDSEFDLLLSDVKLPGVQGGAVARLLKARWPSMRVIVMSGYTEDVAMRADLGSGSFRFLQKPFDMKTLAREVRAALEDSA